MTLVGEGGEARILSAKPAGIKMKKENNEKSEQKMIGPQKISDNEGGRSRVPA